MRKLVSLALAILLVLSMTVIASAESTTTLTTTVPAASYTLNIPADQVIDFGATSTEIGIPTVSDSSGFASGKNIRLTVTTTPFSAPGVSTTIPFILHGKFRNSEAASGMENQEHDITQDAPLYFRGQSTGEVESAPTPATNSGHTLRNLYVNITSASWGLALSGEYTATITFSAEVVVGA